MRYWYRHQRRAYWYVHAQANTPRKLSTATTTHSPPPQPPRPPQHRRPGAAQACACRSLASSGRSSCALPARRSLHERASMQQHDVTTAAHSSHGHTLGDGGGGGGGPLIRGSSGLSSSKLQPHKRMVVHGLQTHHRLQQALLFAAPRHRESQPASSSAGHPPAAPSSEANAALNAPTAVVNGTRASALQRSRKAWSSNRQRLSMVLTRLFLRQVHATPSGPSGAG